jgi:DNA-binding response OmpR family regulator
LLEMLSRMPRLVGGASPSILVAEDDMMTRMLMRKALVQAGYQVLEAENGYSALKMFDQQRPDVVLLDVMMPQIDGFSVCEEIRQRPGGDSVPVLIVTGLEDIDSITRAYDVGATDFITKPINWMVLSHRVRYALRVSQAQEEMLKNQAQLVAAQRIAHMGNWEWQLEGQNVLDFSIEASRILGLSEEPRQFALPEL